MPAERAWKLMHDHIMRSPLESMLCPITRELLVDPVMAQDGHTYEKSALLRHLECSNRSPMTNEPLLHNVLQENHQCKMAVAEYQETVWVAVSQMVPALLDLEELSMVEGLLDKAAQCNLEKAQLTWWRISLHEKSISSASIDNVLAQTPALCALADANMTLAGNAVAKLDTCILAHFHEHLMAVIACEPGANIVIAELLRRRFAEATLVLQLHRHDVGKALLLALKLLGMPAQPEKEQKEEQEEREEGEDGQKYFEYFDLFA